MAERLRPDGIALPIGDVVLYTPGLGGTATVHTAGTAGMRAAEETSPRFLNLLADNGFEEQLTVEIAEPVELDASGGSRAAGGDNDIILEAPGPGTGFAQVLLYTAEDGSLSWHLPDDVPADPEAVASRGADRRTYRIPRSVVITGGEAGQRGVLDAIGKKLLKVLVFPLVDPVLGAVAGHFAKRWEERNRRNRVRVFDSATYRHPEGPALEHDDWVRLAEGPALLFVHGTMSQAHTGFGSLPEPLVAELTKRYGGRVIAFDHHTISVTPTDNAKVLASFIPDGLHLTVDVVAHSRGGLVSRVLCERPGEVSLAGRLDVRTLVMVATPNAGTALAQPKHLGSLVDRVTNLFQFLPDNPVTDTLDAALTVLKQLAVGAFAGLDGLMSMNPEGPYLREYLNQPGQSAARYRAVAANYEPAEGSALLRVARDGVVDIVFGKAENDLIVPTEGVFNLVGPPGFPVGEPLLFEGSAGVDHSTVWPRPEFADVLRAWLAD